MTGFTHESMPLVGREREQAALREHLAAALGGRGSLVLIGGEAGIGKTALAAALCREGEERGAPVLVGRCYDLTETPPYGPFVELFGHYQPTQGMPPLPSAFTQRGTVGTAPSQATLFQQVFDFFIALAASRPLILLLDDLHWADPASLDLLRFLARSAPIQPPLLIATYRADELTRRHPLYQLLPVLVREASAARVDLHPLTADDVALLVAGRYGLADEDVDRLVAYLHARSEGNPFFTGELLRTLEEEGQLQDHDGISRLGDLTNVRVPALLRQMIDGRLARLSDDAQDLLALAAVIGHEVPLSLWAAVAGTADDTVLVVVEAAAGARLLDEPPDGMHARFVHALIREALYEGIAPSQRRRMHQHIGEALAALPDADPDAVAYHLRQAGDPRAGSWLVRAGERAQRAWAWPTASERYQSAFALVEETDATAGERGWLLFRMGVVSAFSNTEHGITDFGEAARLAVIVGDDVLAKNSLFRQGNLRYLKGDVRRGLADMEEGLAGLGALPAIDQSRMAALTIPGIVDEQYGRGLLCNYLANVGRYADAQALWADWLPSAGSSTPHSAFAYRGLGHTFASLGRYEEARQAYARAREALIAGGIELEAGLAALDELRYVALVYRPEDVAERWHLAAEAERLYERASGHQRHLPASRGRLPLMVLEGDWGTARSVGEAVIAVGGHGAYLSRARSVLGPLAYEQGAAALARRLVRDALPTGPETVPGDLPWFTDSLVMQRLGAALAIEADALRAAHAWLEAHDHWLAWSGSILGRAEGRLQWAAYYRAAGDPALAYEHATQAQRHASEPRQPLTLIAAHRLLGELDTDAGRLDDAAPHLDAALALADACAAPYERGLTLLALAGLRTASHDPSEAKRLLDEVRVICLPLGAAPALARADALAARLAVSAVRAAYPAGLSAREVEVLRLLAAGKTNREIAEALFLSIATVNNHVAHILTKTNTDNRAAAAVYAQRHGLA